MAYNKVRWIREPDNIQNDNKADWPRYEQEVLTYKILPGKNIPNVIFDSNSTDEYLEKHNFYRIVANTMPIQFDQTFDPGDGSTPISAEIPFEVASEPSFEVINGRTLHMFWGYSNMGEEHLTKRIVEWLEAAKSYVIEERPITVDLGTGPSNFSWKVRDVVYWRELLNSLGSDTVNIYTHEGVVINNVDAAGIQTLVDASTARRIKLENLCTAYMTEANSATLMEKYILPTGFLARWDAL